MRIGELIKMKSFSFYKSFTIGFIITAIIRIFMHNYDSAIVWAILAVVTSIQEQKEN
jgi:hypothetical protein